MEGENVEKVHWQQFDFGYFPPYSHFSSSKHTLSLTSPPSTHVGVGLGCSSCYECVLAVWDRPMATLWEGLPEETSNSVRTFLWARSLQAVLLWSANTHTHTCIYTNEHLAKTLVPTQQQSVNLGLTLLLIYPENIISMILSPYGL